MVNFRSYQLAKTVYLRIKELDFDRYEKDQIKRASLSIVLNLAEGSSRPSKKDQMRFYTIAFGSLRECQSILELNETINPSIVLDLDKLGAMIYKLIHHQ